MSPDAESGSDRLSELSWALLSSTLACAVVALVAALRVSDVSMATAWVALWGSASLMVAPVAAALRAARPFPRVAWCVPLGVLVALAPLLVFARVLKTATHHRPLGGATFAIIATGVVLGCVAFAARLLVWSGTRGALGRRAPLAVAVVFGLAGAKLAAGALLGPLRSSALDALLCVVAVGVGGFVALPAPVARWVSRLGVPLFALAVVLGLFVGLGPASVRGALDDRAPVLLGLAGWLRGG